jgi:Fe-S oxidoreductase
VRNFVFHDLLPNPHVITDFARIFRLYQRSGLQAIARAIGVLHLLGLSERERFLPRIDDHFFYQRYGWSYPAAGPRRARVAFFAGCIANVTFSQLNEATIRVLTANGCEVVVPKGQLCCGALAAHAGVRDAARELAQKNLAVFLSEDFDAIITNSAGCGSTLKEYHHLFSPEEPEFEQARVFSKKVRDVTEFLTELGLTAKLKPLPLRVTYQDSCHLLHGQKIREAPRALLRAIPKLDLAELPDSEICCGSAGIYNVTQTDTSLQLLAEKMRQAQSTRAPIIATANPGCHQPASSPRRRTPRPEHTLMMALCPTPYRCLCAQRFIFLRRSFVSAPFISSLETAAPFPQRWGLLRKGRAVFRREDRYFKKLIVRWWRSRRRRRLHSHAAVAMRLHGVVRRHRKERRRLFAALDIRQRVARFSVPRIAPLAHHRHLQIVGVPVLGNNHNRILVPDLSHWNRARVPRSLRAHARDRLRAQVFLLQGTVGQFSLHARLEFVSEAPAI